MSVVAAVLRRASETLNSRLSGTGTVTGRVTSAVPGYGVDGCLVTLWDPTSHALLWPTIPLTLADGRYRITKVDPQIPWLAHCRPNPKLPLAAVTFNAKPGLVTETADA